MSALWILPPLALVVASLAVHRSSRALLEEIRSLQVALDAWRPVRGEADRLRDDLTGLGAPLRQRHPR